MKLYTYAHVNVNQLKYYCIKQMGFYGSLCEHSLFVLQTKDKNCMFMINKLCLNMTRFTYK